MTATLATVAARAGVSPATVSRVLNGNYPVAEDTRRKVEEAVRELDYVVNAHARALLHSTSQLVGVILNDISDPFFGTIAGGVHAAAAIRQRLVVTCSSAGDVAQEFAYVEMLRRQRADAVILIGSAPVDDEYRREAVAKTKGLRAQNARLVLVGRPDPGEPGSSSVVSLDNVGGARAATRHLIELGHTSIAHVTGPPERSTTIERRAGFEQALTEAGLRVDPRLIVAGDYQRQSGYDAVKRLVAGSVAFTALFVANDLMAAGALAGLREAGIRVPGDVSVVGCDDVPMAADLGPPMTTVRLPLAEAGRQAVELAFDTGAAREVSLGFEVIVRSSTGPPAGWGSGR